MSQRLGWILVLFGWGLLAAVSLASHTLLPIDETRYATVAWNMWQRGDLLVPWLNGGPYADKPPLLFWIIQAGWALTGVNEWWPRIGPSLVGLLSTLLTGRIARRVWPTDERTAVMAPLILLGCLWWSIFAVATMFDMLVACATLLGVLGLIQAAQDRLWRGFALTGVALGLGLLAKGPTILLQVIPAALLAPWWAERAPKSGWRSWYLGLLTAVLAGVAIVLAWAIPAAIHGGPQYTEQIFWGQTANRMVKSFAHRAPVWWYIALSPIMVFPWLFWFPTWSALHKLRFWCANNDHGLRLCVAWLLPVFVTFSLISGKQPQYLLPLLPAFALGLARLLSRTDQQLLRKHQIGPALAALILAVGLSLVPTLAPRFAAPGWVQEISPLSGIAIGVCGLILLVPRRIHIETAVALIAGLGVLVVLTTKWSLIQGAGEAYDMRPISRYLSKLQKEGTPLAHEGKYHGQFQFLGRLTNSPESVEQHQISAWFDKHPEGRVVAYFRKPPEEIPADFIQRFYGRFVTVLDQAAWNKIQASSR